jgi:hypothetical protein
LEEIVASVFREYDIIFVDIAENSAYPIGFIVKV